MRVPLSLVPAADVFNTVRQILKLLPFPLHIAASVQIVDVTFTTGDDLRLLLCFALSKYIV